MTNRDIYRAALAGEVRAAIARAGMKPTPVGLAAGIKRQAMSEKIKGRSPFYPEDLIAIGRVLKVDSGEWMSAAATAAEQVAS